MTPGVAEDQAAMQVLVSMIMFNMQGEGVGEVRDFFRKRLIKMGVVKPTEEEKAELAQEPQKPDPNAEFLQASAQQANADAQNKLSQVELNKARTEESRAKAQESQAKAITQMVGMRQQQRQQVIEAAKTLHDMKKPQEPLGGNTNE